VIAKLEELKDRAEKLSYIDKHDLDDIQRKTKMYLEKLFPNKFTYPGEVDQIKFTPIYVTGPGDRQYQEAWSNGKQKLINLLDTRIEEFKVEIPKIEIKKNDFKIIEKIVKIEDKTRINELIDQNNILHSKKNLWERINWGTFLTIILSLIGGSFLFGKYIGENRFDREKIQLLDNSKILELKVDTLKGIINKLENKNIELNNKIKILKIKTPS
jgi:hypothetical protein